MCLNITQENGKTLEKQISLVEQLKKFSVERNFANFHQVTTLGLGYSLGIFDYLEEKGKSSPTQDKIQSVMFSYEELMDKLNLNKNYLKAWLKLSLGLGFFELIKEDEKFFKTSPHIYDLFIKSDSEHSLRGAYIWLYQFTILQKDIIANFKKDGYVKRKDDDIIVKAHIQGNKFSASFGLQRLLIFNDTYKEFKELLENKGRILEAGCGYGYNLEIIGKMYKNAHITGIDINLNGIQNARKIVEKHGWNDRVEILNVSVDEFATSKLSNSFDLIVMNEVLHEIISDENERINIVNSLYNLLKDDGILILGERVIPSMTEIESNWIQDALPVILNWTETIFGARHYTAKTLASFFSSIRFKKEKIEQLGEGNNIFWILRKD